MSTSAQIVVFGAKESSDALDNVCFVKHSDGYPTEVLPQLLVAVIQARKLHDEKDEKPYNDPTPVLCDVLAGLCVGSFTKYYGQTLERVASGRREATDAHDVFKYFGGMGYEFSYLLNLDPVAGLVPGLMVIDDSGNLMEPTDYIWKLEEDYRDAERLVIEGCITALELAGVPTITKMFS